MEIEVIYAPDHINQQWIQLTVEEGCTVKQALAQTEWSVPIENNVGIFSKCVSLDTVLQPNDRIEIYAPLFQDPKEARRKRIN